MSQKEIWDARFSAGCKYSYDPDWLIPYISLFREKGVSNVVEFGCGDGACAKLIHSSGLPVVATDISEAAVGQLSLEEDGLEASCVDMSRPLPFPDCSFDAAFSNLSSHYFTTEKTKEIYAEIHRVLTCGGYFLLRVNDRREYERNKSGDTEKALGHNYVLSRNGKRKHYFDQDDLSACLEGFEVRAMKNVSLLCNGREKYAIEALVQKC